MMESGNPQGRGMPADPLFPGFTQQLMRSLAARSAFVSSQIEFQTENECVQLPPELGSVWIESLLLSYGDFRSVDDVKYVQYIKAADFFQDTELQLELHEVFAERVGELLCDSTTLTIMEHSTVKALEELTSDQLIEVLGKSGASFSTAFAMLPASIRPSVAMVHVQGLRTMCRSAPPCLEAVTGPSPVMSLIVDTGMVSKEIMQTVPPSAPCNDAVVQDTCVFEPSKAGTWPSRWKGRVLRVLDHMTIIGSCFLNKRPGALSCSLYPTSQQLENQVIKLPDNAQLMFSQHTGEMTVKNSTVAGGAVVCMGKGCSITFEDTLFERCSLLVLDGAKVTVNGSRFWSMDSSRCGISVYADGEHTNVVMDEVILHGGAQGIAVHSQARFMGVGLSLHNVSDVGLECKGPGSTMELRKVSINGAAFPGVNTPQSVAVHVIDQGHASLSGMMIDIHPHEVGLHASNHASVEMHDSTVSGSVLCCAFTRGSTGTVSSCNFVTYGTCISLQDESTVVDAEQCRFTCSGSLIVAEHWGVANCGVLVRDEARFQGRYCYSEAFGIESAGLTAGYVVYKSGEMECTGCESNNNAHGYVVFGGTLRASNLCMNNCEKYGCWVQSKGVAILKDCTAAKCGKNGVTARNAGSRVDMDNCKLVGNRQIGLLAHEGALVQARNCSSRKHELAGYWAQKYGRMEVFCSTSDEDRRGCGFGDDGQLSMHKVVVNGMVQPDADC